MSTLLLENEFNVGHVIIDLSTYIYSKLQNKYFKKNYIFRLNLKCKIVQLVERLLLTLLFILKDFMKTCPFKKFHQVEGN